MLFNCGIKLGVSPRLISERLLSDLDKNDILSGLVPIASLEKAVEVWRDSGMPNYALGLTVSYAAENKRLKYEKYLSENKDNTQSTYRLPFVDY